jgi:hypothetical protein
MVDWNLIYDEELNFSSTQEQIILSSFASSQLTYEASYNSPIPKAGNLLHAEYSSELGWLNVDRYPLYRGKRFVKLTSGFNEALRLSIVPTLNSTFLLILNLKIWEPTNPIEDMTTFNLSLPKPASAATTVIASSTSVVELLSSNPLRLGASIKNSGEGILYLKLSTLLDDEANDIELGESGSTVSLEQNDYFELPFGYTGLIEGVWSEVGGSAFVTEYV